MVLPNFVKSRLGQTPPSASTAPERNLFCFCDVRDTVGRTHPPHGHRSFIGEVIQIGNTEEITIEALAQRREERTGSSSPIEYVPYDQAYEPGFGVMMRRVPSVESSMP